MSRWSATDSVLAGSDADGPSACPPRDLAKSPRTERSWGHANTREPDERPTLDRFEAAVAFAIAEAERLRHARRPALMLLGAIER